MDAGIVKNWKVQHYRSQLNVCIVAASDTDQTQRAIDVAKSINVLDAIYLAKTYWEAVTRITIVNCYRKAGFFFNEAELTYEVTVELRVANPLGVRKSVISVTLKLSIIVVFPFLYYSNM